MKRLVKHWRCHCHCGRCLHPAGDALTGQCEKLDKLAAVGGGVDADESVYERPVPVRCFPRLSHLVLAIVLFSVGENTGY